jgi:very-short-patch-repair endonuclease
VLDERSAITVDGSLEERLAAIARHQRGYVSRGQLLCAGIDSSSIVWLTAKRRLLVVHRGVYLVAHDAPRELGPETAALLAIRDGGSLSHDTAAILWGLRRPETTGGVIHVTVPGSPGGRPDGVCVHRSKLLTSRDLRLREGLPVTAPARVLLDIAPTASDRGLERTLDQGLVERVLTIGDVTELLRRCGRHRGRARVQALVDRHTTTTFTRSEAEELFLSLVREAGLPQPLTNVRRHGFEIDFVWPAEGVAVEIDGFVFHHTRRRFEGDHRKDAILGTAGIRVTRVTWGQLHDEPLAVIARLAFSLSPARTGGR